MSIDRDDRIEEFDSDARCPLEDLLSHKCWGDFEQKLRIDDSHTSTSGAEQTKKTANHTPSNSRSEAGTAMMMLMSRPLFGRMPANADPTVMTQPAEESLTTVSAKRQQPGTSFDAVDRLNMRISQHERQSKQTMGGSLLVRHLNPFPTAPVPWQTALQVVGPPTGDNIVQRGLKSAGLISDFRTEAVLDLVELFRTPAQYQKFKEEYHYDTSYRERFEQAAATLFPDRRDYDKYIRPLVETGTLPREIVHRLKRG